MQTLAELGIELPKMNMNPYIFVDHKQMMMDQLLSEVSELKEELKNAREENMRNFMGITIQRCGESILNWLRNFLQNCRKMSLKKGLIKQVQMKRQRNVNLTKKNVMNCMMK